MLADLYWSVYGPPLLSFESIRHHTGASLDQEVLIESGPANWPWNDDKNIVSHLNASEKGLLGKKFESLIHYWLFHHGRFEVSARNLQLEEGRTLTEFDFILSDIQNQHYVHLETACKYFLAVSNSTSHAQWAGTNAADRLDRKLATTRRQFQLLHSFKSELLPEKREIATSCLFLKGYFFVPFKLLGNHRLPEGAHAHCDTGWYVRASELGTFESEVRQWWLPPRERWMAPVAYPIDTSEILDGYAMNHLARTLLNKNKKSPLVIQLIQTDHGYRELSRGFVVEDRWPTT